MREAFAYEVTYANKTVVLVWDENELDPDNVEVWGSYKITPLAKANPKQAAIRKSNRLLLSTMAAVTMGSQAYYKDPPLF